jgi:hypothetical protein
LRRQAGFDVAQALSVGQLSKGHRAVLLGTGGRSHPAVATIARDYCCDGGCWRRKGAAGQPGAYLTDWTGATSRCGDEMIRVMLYAAAQIMRWLGNNGPTIRG